MNHPERDFGGEGQPRLWTARLVRRWWDVELLAGVLSADGLDFRTLRVLQLREPPGGPVAARFYGKDQQPLVPQKHHPNVSHLDISLSSDCSKPQFRFFTDQMPALTQLTLRFIRSSFLDTARQKTSIVYRIFSTVNLGSLKTFEVLGEDSEFPGFLEAEDLVSFIARHKATLRTIKLRDVLPLSPLIFDSTNDHLDAGMEMLLKKCRENLACEEVSFSVGKRA